MQQIKAVLRGPDGVKMIKLAPEATITLWQTDGSAVPGVLLPSSLLASVYSFSMGEAEALGKLIWVVKVNWSGTNSESCTVEAHVLDGTITDESGHAVAVYKQVS